MTLLKEIINKEQLDWLYIKAGLRQANERRDKVLGLSEDIKGERRVYALPSKHIRQPKEDIRKMQEVS